MRFLRPLLPLLLVGCHTDAFEPGSYGAVGVYAPGPEAQLTFTSGAGFQASNPGYSQDGGLIVYRFTPRYPQLGDTKGVRDPNDTCMAGLPGVGGSARWAFCEAAAHQGDSTNDFVTAAANSANQLLYVEATSSSDLPIPLRMHAELWLGTQIEPFVQRVKILQLYHERGLGISADDSSAVNWITKLAWTGPASFIALGWSRWADGSLHNYGVVTGSISGGQATLTRIAGTENAADFSPATVAGGVLYIDGVSLVIRRAAAPGDTNNVVATIPKLTPPLGGRVLGGLSCVGNRCVAVTREPTVLGIRSVIWGVNVSSGAVTQLRADVRASQSIALSPISGDVVIASGQNLYLLAGLAPLP